MEQKAYNKRSGMTNFGWDYEILGVANFAIDLVTNEDIKDFHISSNHPDFGAFDDIVIETEQEKSAEVYAIQLKHSDRGTLHLRHLTAIRGNFSIQKFFDSAKSIKVAETNFVLYTNLKFNVKNDTTFRLDGEDFPIKVTKIYPKEAFKISEKTDYCYKFSIVKDASFVDSDKSLDYDKFFDNFFLCTDQENVHELKLRVNKKFKTYFCGNDTECNEYIRFVSEWSSQGGTIEKLDKEWMREVIALKVFSSRVKPLSFDNSVNIGDTEIARRNILREAINTFNVSIFGEESYDEIKKLWVDAKNELTDLKLINKLRLKYHLSPTFISDIAAADSLTLSLLLWLMGKAPLVLTQDISVSRAIELCVGKKFILLGDDCAYSVSENISLFKTLSDLKVKTTQYDRLIENFTCSLQGKRDLSVENLIRNKEEILTVLKTDDLLQMVKCQCLIGEVKERLSEPHIDRFLSKNAIDIKILDNLNKETVVILDCVSRKTNLKNTLTKNQKLINISNFLNSDGRQNIEHSVKNFSNSFTIYLSEQRCEHSEFNAICNKVKNAKSFHQFRMKDDGNLEWIRSRGDVSDIEKYKLSEYYYIMEFDLDHPDFKNTINLLSSDPGTGKSELMKSFKIKVFPEFFTVIIEPKDAYSFLKNNSDVTNHADALFKFLLNEKYKTLSDRDEAIFRIFLKQHKIIIVWEALDEVSDEHRDLVSDIIVKLSKNFIQWVTCRRHLLNTLQQKFKVLGLDLNKFDEREQTHYIERRLAHLDKTETIKTILEKISSSFALVEHKDILGIPLQIFMLTELFRQDKKKYSAFLDNSFLLTDLYNYFIEEKTNIQFQDKLETDLNTRFAEILLKIQKKQMLELCTRAALRLLFPDEILIKLGVHDTDDFGELFEIHQNIGLITEIKDNMPRFIHNSFAEYLAARYLSLQSRRKDILMEIMFDPKYTNVRFFFDLLLARDSKAHVAILHKNFSFIKSCDSEFLTSTDLGGRSLLHLACSWGQRYPKLAIKRSGDSYVIDDEGNFNTSRDSDEYLEAIDYLLEKCDIYKPDEMYNMTPTEYAQISACLSFEMRIAMKQKTEKTVEIDHVINILYYSAHCGYYDEFAFYFELFEQELITGVETGTKSKSLCSTLVNVRNNSGMTLIYIAARMGHLKIVQILLKAGADVNLPDNNSVTPLYTASENGHEAIVEILLKAGADGNFPAEDGSTPLYIASGGGYETIVEMLLRASSDISLPDKHGWTPLHIASSRGHETIVKILLKKDSDISLPDMYGRTPFHIASSKGHETIAKILLKEGSDISLPDMYGWTPLHIASSTGHETIVKILLKEDSDINLPDKYGWTPLHIASSRGHETIAELLLKAGSDIGLANNLGATPLYVASQEGHETIVEMLLKAGTDINFPCKDGWTSLHVACQNGNERIVEILLKAGADSNLPSKDGSTPLHIASHEEYETIVELLIKAGAGINLPRKDGATPLHVASQNGHEAIVEILLKSGADSNLLSKDGSTPLHIASHEEYERIVALLIKAGANPNLPNKNGATPLSIASQEGHETILEILRKAGEY